MKKIMTVFFCVAFLYNSAFAGKTISKEPSPLSVIESQEERDSWCEHDGYVSVGNNRSLHYWLYDSYKNHDGDTTAFLSDIVPKWFEDMGYYVYSDDYKTYSPTYNIAEPVKKLMKDYGSDISIAFCPSNDNSDDCVLINSYDKESGLYSTFIFSGTKINLNQSWFLAPELKEWRDYLNSHLQVDVLNTYLVMLDEKIITYGFNSFSSFGIPGVGRSHQMLYSNIVPEDFDYSGKLSDDEFVSLLSKTIDKGYKSFIKSGPFIEPFWYKAPELKGWRDYLTKNLSEDVLETYITLLNAYITNTSYDTGKLNIFSIRAVVSALKVCCGDRVPSNFKSSGNMSEKKFADLLNKIAF